MANEIKVIINATGVMTGGKEIENGLQKIRVQARQTQTDLQQAVKVDVKASLPQLDAFAGGLSKISGGISALRVLGPVGIILGIFGGAALKAAGESEKFNNALLGLKTIAKSTGNDMDAVTKAAKDLSRDGLVPLTDTAAGLKNLLSKGFSLEESVKLFQALKDSAAFGKQGFLSMGEAIRGATEGLKNENSIMTDNAGITKNLSVMVKEYAASIGVAAGSLTDAQKRQAYFTGFMKEGARTAGDAAKLVDTYTGAKQRLSVSIERATARLGDFITQSSLVKGAISAVADAIDNMSYSSNSADEKIKILERDLANFKPGLNFSADRDKQDLIDQITELKKIAELDKLRSAQGAYESKLKRDQLDLIAQQAEATKKAAAEETKRLKEVETLKKTLIDAGKSELDTLRDIRDRRLTLAKGDAEARVLIEKDYQEKKAKLEDKGLKNTARNINAENKLRLELRQALTDGSTNPFKAAPNRKFRNEDERAQYNQNLGVGRAVGVLDTVVGGRAGAQKLVSGLGEAGLNMVLPGLGEAAKPLLDAFTQGPGAVKSMVKEFAKSLPDIVTGFIEAIPVFIQTLADQSPVIIEKLAEKAPEIITKLVEAAPQIAFALASVMPKVAIKFISELIKNVPKIITELARAVYDGIKKVLQQLTGSGSGGFFGGGKGGASSLLTTGPTGDKNVNLGLNIMTFGTSGAATSVYKSLKKSLGFAEGGEVKAVNGGTPFQDSVPARLMQGEVVVDRSTTSELKDFLKTGGSNAELSSTLKRIEDLLSAPMNIATDVKVNADAFAKIILQLNRTNQRLA